MSEALDEISEMVTPQWLDTPKARRTISKKSRAAFLRSLGKKCGCAHSECERTKPTLPVVKWLERPDP